jgi:hypothetical protein
MIGCDSSMRGNKLRPHLEVAVLLVPAESRLFGNSRSMNLSR